MPTQIALDTAARPLSSARLRARIRRFIEEKVLLRDGARPEDLAAFDESARLLTSRLVRLITLSLLVACAGFWPFDRIMFTDQHIVDALHRWRLSAGFVLSICGILLSLPAMKRFAPGTFAICSVFSAVLVEIELSDIGTGRPMIYGLFIGVFTSVQYIGPIVPRTLGTLGCTVAALVLAALLKPALLDADFARFCASMFFACQCAIVTGHMVYVPLRQSFLDRCELARANEELDRRVRRKTADLERLTDHLHLTQEEERGRIARDLQDELGQRLLSLRLALANTRRRFDRAPTRISPNLTELDHLINGALDSTRGLVTGLRPAILDKFGLAAAVEWLATQTATRAGLRCHLDLSGTHACSPTIALATYRIAQEALTNVVRHAGARRIDVSLRLLPDQIRLEVVDDGCGFPEQPTERASEWSGLLGIRDRAYALGGELELDNGDAGGARVRLTLPTSTTQAAAS